MKTKLLIVMMVIIVGMMNYHPVMASGVITTCDEASLVTALAGGGVVDFNIGMDCEIVFTSEKVISVDTTIQNTSDDHIVFTGDYYTPIDTRLFTVNTGVSLTLDNLTLQNGKALFGGAIYNNAGNLTIRDSVFLYNTATETNNFDPGGGAIYNFYGVLNITNTLFDNNSAGTVGGAILSIGFTENLIVGSRFTNNTSNKMGVAYIAPEFFEGGGASPIGQAIIRDSYFSDNSSDTGFNIYIYDAVSEISGNTFQNRLARSVVYTGSSIVVSDNIFMNHTDIPLLIDTLYELSFSIQRNYFINNSVTGNNCSAFVVTSVLNGLTITGDVSNNTFYGNDAPSNQATICVARDVIMDLAHNTFLDNNTPTGSNLKITSGANIVTARGNIFQDGDCVLDVGGGQFIDGGNNIAYNATGCFGANVDPQLNPIFSYAFVPSATSPALDAYPAPCAVSDDQFGTSRPQGGMCDIGAIEGSASPNTTVTTCSESALNLALAGGGTVDFNIGADCTIPFTFEKIIGTNTTVQNTSPFNVYFDGGNQVGLFTVNNGASLTLDNLHLINANSVYGGAVFNDESTLNVIDSIFANNSTLRNDFLIGDLGQGGAIYSFGEATTTVTGTDFSNNIATFGGAISVEPRWDNISSQFYYGDMTITDSTFNYNEADGNGGAIYALGTINLNGNSFDGNTSVVGAAVSYYGSDIGANINLINNVFNNHSGDYYAGVVSIWASFGQANFSVQGNHFINNSSEVTDFMPCSALTLYDEPFGAQLIGDVTNNTFSGNNALANGNVVCISDDDGIINLTHNTFADNNAPSGGNLNVRMGAITAQGNIFQDGGCTLDMGGQISDGGNNIAYNATNCVGANVNPQLGALTPQLVHIPTNNTIEYAPACEVATDQLGVSRPFGVACTPGAIEIQGQASQIVTVQFSAPIGFSGEEFSNIGDILRVTTDDNQPTDFIATVTLSVTGGSATSPDYNLTGTLTIPAGTPHNSFLALSSAIIIIDDDIDEADETLDLLLSSPSGAALGAQSTYTYTIFDDDMAGYNLILDLVNDISEPNTSTTFTILLMSAPTGTVVLDFGTTDSSECVANPNTFTFTDLNWNSDQTITIVAQDDAVVDGAQPCEITIIQNASSTASEYSGVANPANIAVMVNDDDVPVVERDLILTENELRSALSAQGVANTQFVVADINSTNITLIVGYAGEYGQVVIAVNNTDLTRFNIASITGVSGGVVSSAYSDFVYQQVLVVMMSAIDDWIIAQIAPATAEIKAISLADMRITITVDVSN